MQFLAGGHAVNLPDQRTTDRPVGHRSAIDRPVRLARGSSTAAVMTASQNVASDVDATQSMQTAQTMQFAKSCGQCGRDAVVADHANNCKERQR
ncbi:hypothetical protein [Sorangium sp. So ce363]|uniref:hypothetical protein n=1 Tax=Sorangium sp. So ce363 TaxID=3133304 RepID=UPI003F5D70CF